jgi:succinate-acetate transporter protein
MKFANPAPLDLSGFALTTWLLSMINIGWFDTSAMPMVLASAFAFGGAAQFCAGLLEYPRGNTFGFVAFCGYGTFRANRVLQSIFLSLWVTFLLLALGEWFGAKALHVAGGYFGLLTAALAFYLAAAEVINETRGEAVLPIGPYRAP